MAKFDVKADDVMKSLTLEYDMSQIRKECLGYFEWRLKLSLFLVRLSTWVLRTNLEVKG